MIKPFMNPLSIQKIPMLGNATFQVLSRIGIRRVQTLADMPVEVLQRILGKNGISLWKKANGIDNSLVQPYHERKSVSTERTFNEDTFDIDYLKPTPDFTWWKAWGINYARKAGSPVLLP